MKHNVRALLLYMVKGDPEMLKVVANIYQSLPKGKQLELLGKARKLKQALENPSEKAHAAAQAILDEVEMTEEQKREGLTALAADYNKAQSAEDGE